MASRYYGANQRPIIVRRSRRQPRLQRGINQQWKIAYADFATAMMAFFMLLWLMSHSEKVSLQGLADYFAPSNATMSNSSGAGSILAGASLGPDGAKSSGAYNPDELSANPSHRDALGYGTRDRRDRHVNERASALDRARTKRLRTAMRKSPILSAAQSRLLVENAPEGTRIELIDDAKKPMFDIGAGTPNAHGRLLIAELAQELARHSERIAIAAHTDNQGAPAKNWQLSAERALAARDIFARAGIENDRFFEVTGRAASEPLYPDEPGRAENRRLTVILMNEASPAPSRLAPITDAPFKTGPASQ